MEFDFFGHGKSWKVMEFELPKRVWTLCKYSEEIATLAAAVSFTGARYLVTDLKWRYLSEINSYQFQIANS